MDHASTRFRAKEITYLIVLDAATSHVWVEAVPSKDEHHVQSILRDWMASQNCRPKVIFADMAFSVGTWPQFYNYHGIQSMNPGPRTPWPNRAEAAIRLFKRMLSLFLVGVSEDPQLATVTFRQCLR